MADATTHEWLTPDDDEEILWENSPTLITAAGRTGYCASVPSTISIEPITIIVNSRPFRFTQSVKVIGFAPLLSFHHLVYGLRIGSLQLPIRPPRE